MQAKLSAGYTLVEVIIIVALIALLAGVTIPNFIRARNTRQSNECISNLKQMDGAIWAWSLENKKTPTATVGTTDILDYLKGSVLPLCPAGGTYAFTTVSAHPTCTQSARGHSF